MLALCWVGSHASDPERTKHGFVRRKREHGSRNPKGSEIKSNHKPRKTPDSIGCRQPRQHTGRRRFHFVAPSPLFPCLFVSVHERFRDEHFLARARDPAYVRARGAAILTTFPFLRQSGWTEAT
jgi:hypothetical protein